MKKTFFITLVLLNLISSAFASSRIEDWRGADELRFVVRDEVGLFQSWGTFELESWEDGDSISEWVARREDGTLVTGSYKGRLEKFKLKGERKERTRLVIRNSKGHFVTWAPMDDKLTVGFERRDIDHDGDKESVYTIRYKGRFVNWAVAKLENWANYSQPVLVVRDSSDDHNNGKILTYVTPAVDSLGRTYYKDPSTGHFLSKNQ
jgi:hypothetical protein